MTAKEAMRSTVPLALAAVLAAAILSPSGCSAPCSNGSSCPGPDYGLLHLSCGDSDLTSVVVSAPCTLDDAGVSWGRSTGVVAINSPSAGTCHV